MSETKESPSATEMHVEHQDDVESGGSEKVVFEHDKLRSKIEGVNQTRFDTVCTSHFGLGLVKAYMETLY